jgi:hypothetical protein
MDQQPDRSEIEDDLQKLCDARDRTAPGSPEEEQAALALLDAMLSGGRPQGPEVKKADREDSF